MDVKQIKHELRLAKVTVANKRKAVWVQSLGGAPFAKDEKRAWIPHGVRILTVCYGRTFWAETKVEEGSGKNVAFYRLSNVETGEETAWVTNPSEAMRLAQRDNANYPEGYNGRLQFAIGYDTLQDRIIEEFGDLLTDLPRTAPSVVTRSVSRKRQFEEDDATSIAGSESDDKRAKLDEQSIVDDDEKDYWETFTPSDTDGLTYSLSQIEPAELGEPHEDADAGQSFDLAKIDSLVSTSSTVYRSRSQSSMVDWDLALSREYLSMHGMVEGYYPTE